MNERTQQMARLYTEEGLSYAEIGRRYGVTRQYVGQLLTPLGLARGQVSRRRADRAAEFTGAHERIMRRETTISEEAEKAGFKHVGNYRAALKKYGLVVRLDRAPPEHGTHTRYKSPKHRCRCDLCTAANREYMRGLRDREPSEHGTASSYSNYACRCPKCKEAHRLYTREKRAKKRQRRFSAA